MALGRYGDRVENTPTLFPFSLGGLTLALLCPGLFLWNTNTILEPTEAKELALKKHTQKTTTHAAIFVLSIMQIFFLGSHIREKTSASFALKKTKNKVVKPDKDLQSKGHVKNGLPL